MKTKGKLFPAGPLFKEAVKAYRSSDQQVKELENARRALYRMGADSFILDLLTNQLRRRIQELHDQNNLG